MARISASLLKTIGLHKALLEAFIIWLTTLKTPFRRRSSRIMVSATSFCFP